MRGVATAAAVLSVGPRAPGCQQQQLRLALAAKGTWNPAACCGSWVLCACTGAATRQQRFVVVRTVPNYLCAGSHVCAGTRQHAEYMWRITKDENQRSFIQREDIVE